MSPTRPLALTGALTAAALALVVAQAACSGDGDNPQPAPGLPTVTVVDQGPGVFDVTLRPEVAGGEPLRGLQVELRFDPAALMVEKVEGGPAAGRMDTVYDDGARREGVLLAGVTDLRKVALPLSGGALRVRYRALRPGRTTIEVQRAIGARARGERVLLPRAPGDITVQ